MDIRSSRLTLAASHSASSTRALQVRREPADADGSPRGRPLPDAGLRISAAALASSRAGQATASAIAASSVGSGRALAGGDPAGDEADRSAVLPPEFALLEDLVFRLTGQRLRVFDASTLRNGEAPSPPPTVPPTAAAASSGASGDARFIATEAVAEAEATSFSAEGEILTADGERLRFQVSLAMSRSFASVREFRADAQGKPVDPIVINFAGTAAELREARFQFDLDADGDAESIPTLAAGSGYLVFDRNGNGRVDDGRELFGPTRGDGYAELAAFDADGDGWVDGADPRFDRLAVWSPDGRGEGTLRPLAEAGVAALGLDRVATPFALRGVANAALGEIRSTGLYVGTDRRVGTTQQIDLFA